MRSWALPSSAPLPPATPRPARARSGAGSWWGPGRALARADHGLVPLDARSIRCEGFARRRCCDRSRSPRTASPVRSVTPPLDARRSSTRRPRTRSSCARTRRSAGEGRRADAAPQNENATCTSSCTTSTRRASRGLHRGRRARARRARRAFDQSDHDRRRHERRRCAGGRRRHERRVSSAVTKVFSHTSRVTLITDPTSAVRAVDAKHPRPSGILEHGSGAGSLVLDRIGEGQEGRRSATRSSRPARRSTASCPRSSRAASRSARVTSVGQNDTDLFKRSRCSRSSTLVARVGARAGAEARRRPRRSA